MTMLLVKTAAAICQVAGITSAVAFENLRNYIFMSLPIPQDSRDIPRTVQPTSANFDAMTIAAGDVLMAAPYSIDQNSSPAWWLEQISNVVLTNPPGLSQTGTRTDTEWGDLNNDALDLAPY